MKNSSKFIFSLILLCGQASAATIGWSTAPSTINVNDTFSLNITGSGFTSNVDGGGVNISFDSSVLSVVSVSIDETVWDFGGAGISTGATDNLAGTIDGIMVNTYGTVNGSFDVATILFQAIGSGSSALTLSEYALNPWASGGVLLNPDMVNSSVTVISSVPVPTAVWLLGSGLIGLLGVAKRKSCV